MSEFADRLDVGYEQYHLRKLIKSNVGWVGVCVWFFFQPSLMKYHSCFVAWKACLEEGN